MRQTDPRPQLIRGISFLETTHTCATAMDIHTLRKDACLTFPQGICRLTPSYKPYFVLYLVLNTFKEPRCLISARFCLHILNFVDFIQFYLDIKWPFMFPHTNTELVFSQKVMFYHDDPPDHCPITQLRCGTHSHTDTQRMKPLCISSTLLDCYSTCFSLFSCRCSSWPSL